MNDSGMVEPRHRALVRGVLSLLAGIQLGVGATALLAPAYFFESFPFGRGWVEVLPAFNEHLIRDVGGLFLATAVILGAAAIWLERRWVIVSLLAFLAFTVPHTIYHAFNLGPYSTGDAIANIASLTGTVLAPLFLLVLLSRPGGSGAT